MTKPRHAARFVSLGLMILAFCISALAQSNKGTVVGTVKDPNDALVTTAKVTVTNIATGESREATTGDDGSYVVSNLEPGKYKVTVESTGFQTVVFDDVAVETNARLPLDVKFAVAGGAGTVTVTAESAPLTESETSVRGDVITGRQVTDLPLPQRNFTLLAALSPGVTRPASGRGWRAWRQWHICERFGQPGRQLDRVDSLPRVRWLGVGSQRRPPDQQQLHARRR